MVGRKEVGKVEEVWFFIDMVDFRFLLGVGFRYI